MKTFEQFNDIDPYGEEEWSDPDWIKYTRFECSFGYIDRWMGDIADDPNNRTKSKQNLNQITTYFRLNGEGKWRHESEFRKIMFNINKYKNVCSSNEVWELSIIEYKQH
jgi:hypothetical protein